MFHYMKNNLIYLVSCMDIFAVSLIIPLFTQYLQSIGFSNKSVGLLSSVYSGVQFFASPVIGHLSDVYGSRYVLATSLLICSVCYPIMGITTSFIAIVTVRTIIGIVKHTQLLCKNYIQESVHETNHVKSFGKLNGFTSMGFIFGPAIGGYIIDLQDGFMYMCCITGFIFLINVLFVYYLSNQKINKKKVIRQNQNFFVSFRNIPWLVVWDLFLLKFVTVFSVFAFYSSYNLSVIGRYNVSSILVGYSYSLQAVARSCTGFTIQNIMKLFPNYFGTMFKLQITNFIVIVCYLALYFSNSFYIYLFFLIPLNISLSFIRIINQEALVERTKDYDTGIITGAFNNVTAIGRFVLPLFSGYIVDKYGYDVVYIISIISLLIGVLVIRSHGTLNRVKID